MATWSRLRTSSFSLLPMTTSPFSSTPSSSASLHPHLLFDLADELWFYSSVLPLPSLSDLPLPCLPALFSAPPPPDPSTLLAQCMVTHLSFSRRYLSPPDSKQQNWPGFLDNQANRDEQENHANTFSTDECRDYNEILYGRCSSLSDRDEDLDWGNGEEAYHYYSATSDWDDEDSDNGYHAPCNHEDESVKGEVLPAGFTRLPVNVEPADDNSRISDVGVVLKDQNFKRRQEVPCSPGESKAASPPLVSARPQIRLPQLSEQGDMKENIKLWAHAVASALPWKAAAQARPIL